MTAFPKPTPRPKKPRRYIARASRPNAAYLAWVRTQPCACKSPVCAGPIEADHQGRRGLGQKSGDHEAVPMCRYHHGCRHDGVGVFDTVRGHEMRVWCDEQIELTWGRYVSLQLDRLAGVAP